MQHYHVRIAKDDLVFSAAHFITLEGGVCEPLHGHNYRVAVEIGGPLNDSQYVVDFLVAHKAIKAIIEELDHRVLLPTEHPTIQVMAGLQEVEVHFADRRWIFPRSDCRLLPLAGTTAELLAQYIGRRLREALPGALRVRIEVEESPGQSAVCEVGEE
jgi:6-pyruvoyltetrahydropterin/6-carboxytetrahydropterin synthase